MKLLTHALLWTCLLITCGCEGLFDDLDAGPLDAFRDAGPPVEVGGTWQLSGSGRLTDCDDPRFETNDLTISSTLQIVQNGETLHVAPGLLLAERFALENGLVQEDRVSFATLEEGDGVRIILRFEGRYDALVHEIRGRFTGEGPGTCQSAGTFTIAL